MLLQILVSALFVCTAHCAPRNKPSKPTTHVSGALSDASPSTSFSSIASNATLNGTACFINGTYFNNTATLNGTFLCNSSISTVSLASASISSFLSSVMPMSTIASMLVSEATSERSKSSKSSKSKSEHRTVPETGTQTDTRITHEVDKTGSSMFESASMSSMEQRSTELDITTEDKHSSTTSGHSSPKTTEVKATSTKSTEAEKGRTSTSASTSAFLPDKDTSDARRATPTETHSSSKRDAAPSLSSPKATPASESPRTGERTHSEKDSASTTSKPKTPDTTGFFSTGDASGFLTKATSSSAEEKKSPSASGKKGTSTSVPTSSPIEDGKSPTSSLSTSSEGFTQDPSKKETSTHFNSVMLSLIRDKTSTSDAAEKSTKVEKSTQMSTAGASTKTSETSTSNPQQPTLLKVSTQPTAIVATTKYIVSNDQTRTSTSKGIASEEPTEKKTSEGTSTSNKRKEDEHSTKATPITTLPQLKSSTVKEDSNIQSPSPSKTSAGKRASDSQDHTTSKTTSNEHDSLQSSTIEKPSTIQSLIRTPLSTPSNKTPLTTVTPTTLTARSFLTSILSSVTSTVKTNNQTQTGTADFSQITSLNFTLDNSNGTLMITSCSSVSGTSFCETIDMSSTSSFNESSSTSTSTRRHIRHRPLPAFLTAWA